MELVHDPRHPGRAQPAGEDALLPCPFCAGDYRAPQPDGLIITGTGHPLLEAIDEDGPLFRWRVQCYCCHASIRGLTAEEVVRRWNTRL